MEKCFLDNTFGCGSKPVMGLANNHKICNTFDWTRYGTEDFPGSQWTRGRVLCIALKTQLPWTWCV